MINVKKLPKDYDSEALYDEVVKCLKMQDQQVPFSSLWSYRLNTRSRCSVKTGYVKVPIFPDFVRKFPEFSPISLLYFPILCKLDNLAVWKHNFPMVCIQPNDYSSVA